MLHLYIAWGLTNQFTPDEIAGRAQASGVKTLLLEITPENDPYHAALKAACHSRGLAYGVWEASYMVSFESTQASVVRYAPDCYLADIEEHFDAATWVPRFDGAFPGLPRALCATGGGLETPADAAPWIKNWDCTLQDYLVHGTDPLKGENFAYWRNFPLNSAGFYHIPILEVNAEGSQSLEAQLPLVKPWGTSFGIYSAEYLTDADWQTLRSM